MQIERCTRKTDIKVVGSRLETTVSNPSVVESGTFGGPTSPPFDSHIIFPAHIPVVDSATNMIRVYYMGGNGV
jgi:hypothetical protein